ncbi:MAG: calcium-binding protein [Actinomycetota bacterium]
MRRVIGGVTGTLVIAAVAALILAPGTSSLAKPPSVNPILRPPAGQQAIHSGDIVEFAGQVTPGSTKVSAFIHFERSDGSEFRLPLNVTAQVTFGLDGSISGSRTLNLSPNNPPGSANGHGGRVYLLVTARDPVDGEDTTQRSNTVAIDLIGPSIAKTRLVAPDKVVVDFSEDVILPTQQDSVVDWSVQGVPPISISGTSTEKTLTLANTQTEDATPDVIYKAGAGLVAGRETYHDTTAKNPYVGGTFFTAQDLIPPRTPVVDQVAGKAGSSAVANDPTPEIRLSNITAGHWGEIYREANGQPGLQRLGDGFVGEDQADGSGAQVVVNDLGSDGDYTLYAIARDNAICDPPVDEPNEPTCPNRSAAGAAISYLLDRFAPRPLFAAVTNVAEVTVGFTEAIVGDNNAANWSISGAVVTGVSGSGDRRTITATGAAPGATVTYTPGNYTDEADNDLAGFSTLLLDQLPPIVEFTDPAFDTFVQAMSYTLKGTAERSNQVEIFRDNDGNGTPDGGSPIATATVSGSTWSASVPLAADSSNRFVARGVRTDTTPNIQGPNVPLEAALVQDSQDPNLAIGNFAAAYRGGRQVDINWSASDTNFDGGPMTLEFSPDNGATWELIQARFPNTPPYDEWITPAITTMGAQIRVTATDRAGRSKSLTSPAFEIDSIPPIFVPTILNATQIGLNFTEAVSGLLNPLGWKIDGQPAGQIDPAGPNPSFTSAVLTIGPLSTQIGASDTPLITYEPLTPDVKDLDGAQDPATELEDHVGNSMVAKSRVGAPGGGGSVSVTASPAETAICTVLGTEGADSLFGTDGPDLICPLGGDDHIEAFGGDDIIVTGSGVKDIDGGAGNDEINGGSEADTLSGGPGNDVILAFGGDDQIDGSDGDDILHGDEGADTIGGGTGTDILEGEGGNDHLSGGAGVDYLEGSNGNDSLGGGDADDRLNGHGGDDALRGDSGRDLLDGGDGADTLDGGSGDDELNGSNGGDKLVGDDGNDLLKGGRDNDQILGGTGRDLLLGQANRDKLAGQGGNDGLKGGPARDQLVGGKSRDFCSGGGGPDRKLSCERGPST